MDERTNEVIIIFDAKFHNQHVSAKSHTKAWLVK